MLVDFARDPLQTPIIQGLEFFNYLKSHKIFMFLILNRGKLYCENQEVSVVRLRENAKWLKPMYLLYFGMP